jgi:uncharacterized damage-inducible protein DinB
LESTFVTYAAEKLTQLCARIETCAGQLTPEQIWSRQAENQNAVGNLLLHLEGNVRQWILGAVGGEPQVRDRDREFASRGGQAAAELKGRLHSTVEKAAALIRRLPAERLSEKISVQGYDVTVLEAVFHVVEHFSGHAGQIIFATKFLTGEDLGFYAHLRSVAHGQKTP